MEKMKIRCVRNNGAEKFLTVGKIYEARKSMIGWYKIVADDGMDSNYKADRFEIISR